MSHSDSHPPIEFTQEFWDDRYRSAGQLWSGQPNPVFAAQAADLPPGTALEAACGEGADAIWLARRGWTVTAVDVSAVALERGANAAAEAGGDIAGRITRQREDLRAWGPAADTYDLVSAQFMHFPKADLEVMHRRLAAAVRPGGTLLMVAHHPDDIHAARNGHPDLFWYAEDIAASLEPGRWEIRVAEASGRSAIDHDGQPVTVRDTVLRAVRRR